MVTFKSTSLPYKKAVIDNGPLFTVLTLVFVRQWPRYRDVVFARHCPPTYAIARQGDYLQFFDSINQILFTSHVIGELKSRESKRLPPQLYREFWLSSMDYLKRKHADEKLLALLSMHEDEFFRDIVCSLGPVDAGLVALAKKENCVLLTDDGRLLSRCDNTGSPEIQLVEYLL
jgi:predicted nucleic acid-binding protein